jgi:hypothetical protein
VLFLVHWFLSPWWRWRQVPPKRRFLQEPHGVTTQKTPFFIVVPTSLESCTVGKGNNPSGSECYTPSSEKRKRHRLTVHRDCSLNRIVVTDNREVPHFSRSAVLLDVTAQISCRCLKIVDNFMQTFDYRFKADSNWCNLSPEFHVPASLKLPYLGAIQRTVDVGIRSNAKLEQRRLYEELIWVSRCS